MINDMSPDTRGVTALCDPGTEVEPWIFLELAVELGFDPADAGVQVSEPQAWDLQMWDPDEQYPRSLHEMMNLLKGGGDGFGSGADQRHEGVPGSDCGDQDPQCADARWDYDVGAAVAVQREGSAGSEVVRDGELGAVDDQVEDDERAAAC